MLEHIHVESTASLNTDARLYIEEKRGRHTLLFTADSQSAGRGRQGKSFFSPKGGLYMSLLLPYEQAEGTLALSAITAVAVCRELRAYIPDCGIKWVNDIYCAEGKLCGILCEQVMSADGIAHAIIGIGINISQNTPIPSELVGKIAFLKQELDRLGLANAISEQILTQIDSPSENLYNSYRELSIVIGKRIVYRENGEDFSAQAIDIAPSGALIVREGNATKVLNSGEISVFPAYI